MADKEFIKRREIQKMIDEREDIKYGQDKYSKKILANLDKDDSNKYLVSRKRLTEYFYTHGYSKDIDMDGYTYKKEHVERMLEDTWIKERLIELNERKTTEWYFSDLGNIRVPKVVAEYFDNEQHAQDAENRKINELLNKKGRDLTIEEHKELIEIKSTKVWNGE